MPPKQPSTPHSDPLGSDPPAKSLLQSPQWDGGNAPAKGGGGGGGPHGPIWTPRPIPRCDCGCEGDPVLKKKIAAQRAAKGIAQSPHWDGGNAPAKGGGGGGGPNGTGPGPANQPRPVPWCDCGCGGDPVLKKKIAEEKAAKGEAQSTHLEELEEENQALRANINALQTRFDGLVASMMNIITHLSNNGTFP